MTNLRRLTVLAVVLLGCSGCVTYVTPAGGVSLDGVSGETLTDYYLRQPASPFPANLVVMRVQDSGYYTKTAHGYGSGRYSIVTTRDVETDEDYKRLTTLSLVSAVAPVGRLLLPSNAQNVADLRVPAAKLRADLLLLYSIDTSFTVDGQSLGPLSVISLGLLPNREAHVTSTVAGVLVDVRTGFIYGTAEATVREHQRATIWSTQDAIETARLAAEGGAFSAFVVEFETLWRSVLDTHVSVRHPS